MLTKGLLRFGFSVLRVTGSHGKKGNAAVRNHSREKLKQCGSPRPIEEHRSGISGAAALGHGRDVDVDPAGARIQTPAPARVPGGL